MLFTVDFDPAIHYGLNLNRRYNRLLEEYGFENVNFRLYRNTNQQKVIPKLLAPYTLHQTKKIFVAYPHIPTAVPIIFKTIEVFAGKNPGLVLFNREEKGYAPVFVDFYDYNQYLRSERARYIREEARRVYT